MRNFYRILKNFFFGVKADKINFFFKCKSKSARDKINSLLYSEILLHNALKSWDQLCQMNGFFFCNFSIVCVEVKMVKPIFCQIRHMHSANIAKCYMRPRLYATSAFYSQFYSPTVGWWSTREKTSWVEEGEWFFLISVDEKMSFNIYKL